MEASPPAARAGPVESKAQELSPGVTSSTRPVGNAAATPGQGSGGSERTAQLNAANEQYGDNTIITSKYTALSFVPRSLFEQFRRTANLYFLAISMLMVIGTFAPSVFQSPLQPYSTLGPLVLVLSITMVKEAVEDYKRHTSDGEVNNRTISILRHDGVEESVRWIDLRVGHIIRVVNKGEVPADIILLKTSEPQGACYIETSNIDGETNLKMKEAVAPIASAFATPAALANIRGGAPCVAPRRRGPQIPLFLECSQCNMAPLSLPSCPPHRTPPRLSSSSWL